MAGEKISLITKNHRVKFRLIDVAGYKTELLEIRRGDSMLHVLLIPGNPGVISFYIEFVDSLFNLLGGTASITAIGHISHTEKNWESGRLFSLQEQIDHKVSFMECLLQDRVPVVLVGHSIGSYIGLEVFRRFQEKVAYCICLYPFLAVNTRSSKQASIRRITESPIVSTALSSIGAFLGKFPHNISRFLAKKILGESCSFSTIEVLCAHVLQYHTLRNMLFMAKTEFCQLLEKPNWDFLREKKTQISFLFGLDDHWGPMYLYDEIVENVLEANLAIEREGHTHAFCCTKAGSIWVAQHVANLIKNQFPISPASCICKVCARFTRPD